MIAAHRRELRRAQLIRDVQLAVLNDAYLAGSTTFWERRARDLEAARPRPGDHPGGPVDYSTGRPLAPTVTPADAAARHRRLTAAAAACRARAHLADLDLAEALTDLAAPDADLEQQLRHALDAGDRRRIDHYSRLIDQTDNGAAA